MSAALLHEDHAPPTHGVALRDVPFIATTLVIGALLQIAIVMQVVRRVRARRRAVRLGLERRPGARWVVAVELVTDGEAAVEGPYRAMRERVIRVARGETLRRIPLAAVRSARLVRDRRGRFAPRLDDALVLRTDEGELRVPCAADGFDALVGELRRDGRLETFDL